MKVQEPVKALRAALTDRFHLDPKRFPIHVAMEDGALVIEGLVESVATKKRILYLAMGMESVTGVVDRLRVRPATTLSDKEIKKHLVDALVEEPTLDEDTIDVTVKDGVVDLEGTVPSLSHKRLAGVLAWWVPGTMDVINSLEVVPPEEDSDDEISEALRIVLEKDRLVDAGSISISTKNWVVTLSGTAACEAEREAAEADAWYIWGVNDVVNNIVVTK